MNDRKLTVLIGITAVLVLGEFASAVQIGVGADGPNRTGWPFAVVFGAFFVVAARLLRGRRITAGAVFAGVLCLFEVLNYPSWYKHSALNWTYDTAFALVSLAGLIGAVIVLAGRLRRRVAA